MTRWTQVQYENYVLKMAGSYVDAAPSLTESISEHNLLVKCLQYCREKGYPVWHDWSRKKNEAGWPDLIVFLSKGRTCLIELKSSKGYLRTEQQALKRHLLFLGHTVYVVKSYKRFLEILNQDNANEEG